MTVPAPRSRRDRRCCAVMGEITISPDVFFLIFLAAEDGEPSRSGVRRVRDRPQANWRSCRSTTRRRGCCAWGRRSVPRGCSTKRARARAGPPSIRGSDSWAMAALGDGSIPSRSRWTHSVGSTSGRAPAPAQPWARVVILFGGHARNAGRGKRRLATWRDSVGRTGDYRDVRSRIDRLGEPRDENERMSAGAAWIVYSRIRLLLLVVRVVLTFWERNVRRNTSWVYGCGAVGYARGAISRSAAPTSSPAGRDGPRCLAEQSPSDHDPVRGHDRHRLAFSSTRAAVAALVLRPAPAADDCLDLSPDPRTRSSRTPRYSTSPDVPARQLPAVRCVC